MTTESLPTRGGGSAGRASDNIENMKTLEKRIHCFKFTVGAACKVIVNQ